MPDVVAADRWPCANLLAAQVEKIGVLWKHLKGALPNGTGRENSSKFLVKF